jgi:GTP-binding protein
LSTFVDEARIRVQGGRGGHGLIAFRREKFVPRGGPCGGDGGSGGDVVLEVDRNLHTLLDFRYRREFQAPRGQHGGGLGKTGRSGEPLLIRVPPGTEVREAKGGNVLGDLTSSGERLVVARGGRGGRGNQRFTTSTQRAPQFAEDGGEGESRQIILTLKLIADVGLVGFPNAGKSTLLATLSEARPKVADYPFTTLVPHLGIVSAGEYASFVMADIPGLIEGASRGKGLGHRFLRHIERTRVLLFLIDCLDPEPDRSLATLKDELAGHSRTLARKPFRVAMTKIDLLEPGKDPSGLSRLASKPFMISAHSGGGLHELTAELFRLVQEETRVEITRPGQGESAGTD